MPAYTLKEINDKISKLKEELKDWEQKKMMHVKLMSNFKQGSKKKSKRRRRRSSSSKAVNPNKIQSGDFVVHRNHGIGQFQRIEKLAFNGKMRDYLVVIYMDGKLIKTCLIEGDIEDYQGQNIVLTPNTGSETGSFDGFLAKFKKFGKAVTPREAWSTYKEGYTKGGFLGVLNTFGLKMEVTKSGKTMTGFEL